MRKWWRIIVVLLCTFGGGMAIAYGLIVQMGRESGNLGGEILILPLIVGLIYLGYILRQMIEEVKR